MTDLTTPVLTGLQMAKVIKMTERSRTECSDYVVIEEPLEIRLGVKGFFDTLAVTMRTPGQDHALVLGFLLSEGVIRHVDDVEDITCGESADEATHSQNIIRVALRVPGDTKPFQRQVYINSSCGICGRTSISRIKTQCRRHPVGVFQLPKSYFSQMIVAFRKHQILFPHTGGLHAAGLFDLNGRCLALQEDIGRHNAVDKIVGQLIQLQQLPADNTVLLVSGRASFELVQKAVMAGIPMLVAVGAPSSLAVALAEEYGLTLIGFLSECRFNIYCGAQRIVRDFKL
jgi:FdhD protein